MRELERNRDAPTEGAPTGLRSLAVIGAGRTGGSVAPASRAAGLDVRVGTRGTVAATAGGIDITLLCVPDESIATVCAEVAAASDLPAYVGHVSGATGLDALEPAARQGAQTFRL